MIAVGSGSLAASVGWARGASAGTAVDRTQFSFDQSRVRSLASQALATPEIREAKVSALGQAIASGGYSVEPGKVAEAMTAELAGAGIR